MSSVIRSFPNFTIQVICKQGVRSLQTPRCQQLSGTHNATPLPARTTLTHSKMGAEPPSPYDGTSSVTQNKGSRTAVPIQQNVNEHSKHTAQFAPAFQHVFLVPRTPSRTLAQSRTFQTERNVHCVHTGHSTSRARLKQRNAAHQHASTKEAMHTNTHHWCTRHSVSHSTPRLFSTFPTPFKSTIANEQ